jgi:type VI secretion system protein VasD
MGITRRSAAVGLASGALLLAVGCAPKPPAPGAARLAGAIEATAAVNPDSRGRPSPIVVKLFELRAAGAFESADFFALVDREREALGTDLLRKDDVTLRPGERIPLDRPLDPETRYLGVVAGYRNLERARWRTAAVVAPDRVNRVLIRLDAAGVTVATD